MSVLIHVLVLRVVLYIKQFLHIMVVKFRTSGEFCVKHIIRLNSSTNDAQSVKRPYRMSFGTTISCHVSLYVHVNDRFIAGMRIYMYAGTLNYHRLDVRSPHEDRPPY